MTTQKIKTDYLDNEYIDPDTESTDQEDSPWEDPLLIAKNTNSTDKQIFQKEKIVAA